MANNYIDLIGIRLVKEGRIKSDTHIETPLQAVEVLANELKYMDREVAMTMHLNSQNQLIGAHIISIGTINQSPLDIKSVMKSAILSNSSRIMLLHNHPSGDPTPSKADIEITERVGMASAIMGFDLLDSIVIGEDGFYSILGQSYFPYTHPIHETELTL